MNLINLILIVSFIILLAWVIIMLLPEKAFVRNGKIYKRRLFRSESLAIEGLEQINFHYHAVAGFTGLWEFIASNEKKLMIDSKANGINKVLMILENELKNFSLEEFDRKFDDGGVVDSIDVWRSA